MTEGDNVNVPSCAATKRTEEETTASPARFIHCPACHKHVLARNINEHLDSDACVACEDSPLPPRPKKQRKLAPVIENKPVFTSAKSLLPKAPPVMCVQDTQETEQEKRSDQSEAEQQQRITTSLSSTAPLADRVRPSSLDDFIGQEEAIGKGTILRNLIERDAVPSLIFWGPPGSFFFFFFALMRNYRCW